MLRLNDVRVAAVEVVRAGGRIKQVSVWGTKRLLGNVVAHLHVRVAHLKVVAKIITQHLVAIATMCFL